MHIVHPIEETQQRVNSFFQNKPVSRMNQDIHRITNKRMNEWENDDSDFLQALYRVYKNKENYFSIVIR